MRNVIFGDKHPDTKFLKKERSSAEELQHVIKKVLQAYRFHIRIMERRKEYVDHILKHNTDFGIPGEIFYGINRESALRLIKYEKKLLSLIKFDEKKEEQLITKTKEYLFDEFKKLNRPEAKQLIEKFKEKGIEYNDLRKICVSIIQMLKYTEQMLDITKLRIKNEEIFLEKLDAESFTIFARIFYRELEGHTNVEKILEEFIEGKEVKHFKAFIKSINPVWKGFQGGFVGSIMGTGWGAIESIFKGSFLESIQDGAIFMGSFAMVLFGLVSINEIKNSYQEEKHTIRSSDLMKNIENYNKKKRKWYHILSKVK